MATAYLFHESKVLMIRKKGNRFLDFDFWSGIGGHMEPEELNDPGRACLREIGEETGLTEGDLADLRLRYILADQRNGNPAAVRLFRPDAA